MLLHICPRIYWPYKDAVLVDLEIKTLGLRLVGGVDLITRRPFPNKGYKVACRKRGHDKAFNGILIETPAPLDEFDTLARWAIEAQTVVIHHVHYQLLDHVFDAASDDMTLWYGTSPEDGGWSNRRPEEYKETTPMKAEPLMQVLPGKDTKRRETTDTLDAATGWITKRVQSFAMPTIERERMNSPMFNDRMPPFDSAFVITGPNPAIRPGSVSRRKNISQ